MNRLKNNILKSLEKDIRYDGRKLLDYRKIVVEPNAIKNAEGSARVKIGDTEVIVGVKLEVGTPYPDTPDEGALMVGVELYPLSNPEFELGPPSIEAVELARVIDRGVRESKSINQKKLCIKEKEKVWIVVIDVCIINDSGNLFDASALAALVALKNTKFPEYKDEKIDYKIKTKKSIPIEKEPIEITVYKIGKYFMIDPNSEEEKAYDARLTVAITDDENICALQKGGDSPLTSEDIDEMINIALKKNKELRVYI